MFRLVGAVRVDQQRPARVLRKPRGDGPRLAPGRCENYTKVGKTSSRWHVTPSNLLCSSGGAATITNRVRPPAASRVRVPVWAHERFDALLRAALPRECGVLNRRW